MVTMTVIKQRVLAFGLLGATLFFSACNGFYARPCGGPGMGPGHHGYGYAIGGPVMWLLGLLVLAVVAFAVYYFFIKGKAQITPGASDADSDSPQDILKKRYARGEISKEEYESLKEDIERM